jgi:hypothetical protein
MFSVQQPMDIIEGQFGVHIDSLAEPRNLLATASSRSGQYCLSSWPKTTRFRASYPA